MNTSSALDSGLELKHFVDSELELESNSRPRAIFKHIAHGLGLR